MGPRLALLVVLALAVAPAPAGGAVDAPAAGCRWEALTRRGPGLFPGTSRWDAGALTVRDEKIVWTDARDPGRNLIVPLSRVTGHRLVCREVPPAACSEWRLSTRREEYRFRDLASGPNGSARLAEIDEHIRSVLSDQPPVP